MTGDEGPRSPGPDGGAGPRPGDQADEPPEEEGPVERPGEGLDEGPEPLPEEEGAAPGEDGPVGIFPSWRWVYGTVLAWFVVVVVALYVLTVALDVGAP